MITGLILINTFFVESIELIAQDFLSVVYFSCVIYRLLYMSEFTQCVPSDSEFIFRQPWLICIF